MKIKILISILVVLLIAGGAGGTYYYYSKYQETKKTLSNSGVLPQTEIDTLISKLGKLIELPTDEQPQIGTVSEADLPKVKDQAFFAKAVSGDRVFIYNKAMKAILFRESANKIIEVAPLTITPPASTEPASSPKAQKTPTPEQTASPI